MPGTIHCLPGQVHQMQSGPVFSARPPPAVDICTNCAVLWINAGTGRPVLVEQRPHEAGFALLSVASEDEADLLDAGGSVAKLPHVLEDGQPALSEDFVWNLLAQGHVAGVFVLQDSV